MAFESFESDDVHPIDIAETIADYQDWDFDRIGQDQIAMAVAGQWREYSLTLALSTYDGTLRLICTFDLQPPPDKLPNLYEILNLINDQCWSGALSYWSSQQLIVYRYSLLLSEEHATTPEQIRTMINTAVIFSERFYPALQLAVWGDKTPAEALRVAINEAYGRA